MPRRKRIFTKPDRRDPRYDSALVGHLITKVMESGKRSLAQRIVYAAIDRANEGVDTVDPLEVITRAVENTKPRVEVKSRRVGGATYQVPLEVAKALRCMLPLRMKLRTLQTTKAVPSANATMCTKWHKPTAPSLTSDSDFLTKLPLFHP
jgi:small subunit ribosomal protein S7